MRVLNPLLCFLRPRPLSPERPILPDPEPKPVTYLRPVAVAVLALCAGLAPAPVSADSLWPEGGTESLIGDLAPRKWEKHDLITLVVDEQTLASASADTRSDRRTRLEIALAKWIRFNRKKGGASGDLLGQLDDFGLESALGADQPEVSLDSRVRNESPASTKRESQFRMKVQAEVVDIQPNGNLVIEARKHRTVNEETETITMSGTIRPEDVDGKNAVRSDLVADLDVKLVGAGSVGDKQRRGFMSRLLDFLWPF